MHNLLSPKNDFVFKTLFTKKVEILADLINHVLNLQDKNKISSLEIKNPQILPEEITKKFIVLDILCTDEYGAQYNIEMQVRKYKNYPLRATYYLCEMFVNQLWSGENYFGLKPAIGIHFIDYVLYSVKDKTGKEFADFHYHFQFNEMRYPEIVLPDNLSLHFFQLPETDKLPNSPEFEWFHFINHAHEQGGKDMQLHYSNPLINEAYGILQDISADATSRQQAKAREKAVRDEISFLAAERIEGRNEGRIEGRNEGKIEGKIEGKVEGKIEGKAEGKIEGKAETAIKMLETELLSLHQISAVTDLSIADLEKLKTEIGS